MRALLGIEVDVLDGDRLSESAMASSDAGRLIVYPRLNGASSKSICGGSWRQSKMSFVFRQICNHVRLSTFSWEQEREQER